MYWVFLSFPAVGNKLLMLFFPFLRKWTYARMHEQVGTNCAGLQYTALGDTSAGVGDNAARHRMLWSGHDGGSLPMACTAANT